MFGNEKNKKIDNDQELITKINQEMLVRNMPSMARLNNFPVSASKIKSGGNELLSGSTEPKNNFKIVGILIIFGGLVLVGGLIYASYVFIVKPQTKVVETTTKQPQKTSSILDTINSERASTTGEINMATTSLMATVTPIALDLDMAAASSTASSTSEEAANNDLPDNSPILDSDADGLNDDEEAILGTDRNLADTNSNGYADLTEIENNYNSAAAGKLETNPNLAKYENKSFSYSILYPKAWNLKSLSEDSSVIFTAPDNSIIQISVQENSDKQSIVGWYGNTFPEETITYDKIKSTEGWDGIWGSNNLNFYLTDKNKTNIYVVSFISPIENKIAYPNIFHLMINSLNIK